MNTPILPCDDAPRRRGQSRENSTLDRTRFLYKGALAAAGGGLLIVRPKSASGSKLLTLCAAVLIATAILVSTVQAQTGITITRDGTTLVAPNVRCSGDPTANSSPMTKGIRVKASNVTIYNPHVENCQRGITIERDGAGQVVQNVRVLGDASRAGYATSELRHNRNSLHILRLNGGEFGDVSDDGVDGGRPLLVDTYRGLDAQGSNDVLLDDLTLNCGTTVWGSGAPGGGCHWGVKWLSDRPTGAPYLVSGNVVRDMEIRGVDDEGLGMDGRFDVPDRSAIIGTDTISALSAANDTVTLNDSRWGNVGENVVGQYLTVATGPQQGKYLRITAKSGRVFTVADPDNTIRSLATGQRVSVGMAYDHNSFVSNTVYAKPGKAHLDTNGLGNYTRIANNTFLGANRFNFGSQFHFRTVNGSVVSQCIDIKTAVIGAGPAGTTKLGVSSHNSVVNNYCENGDISINAITWSQPPAGFTVDNYWSGNTFGQGQLISFLNNNLASDPVPGA